MGNSACVICEDVHQKTGEENIDIDVLLGRHRLEKKSIQKNQKTANPTLNK